jgi:hypothetical protein
MPLLPGAGRGGRIMRPGVFRVDAAGADACAGRVVFAPPTFIPGAVAILYVLQGVAT